MKKIKTIGIVCETIADAQKASRGNLDACYHWREPEELAAICSALQRLGFTAEIIGPPAKLLEHYRDHRPTVDFIMNLSVGFHSRFRLAAGPALFELAGLPYCGADPYAKQLSQCKHLQKSLFDKVGLPTPAWVYIDVHDSYEELTLPPFPLIVKPAWEGSSIGIDAASVVNSVEALHAKIEVLRAALDMPIIVEQFIIGKELKVGMLGNAPLKFEGIIEDVHLDGTGIGADFLHFDLKKVGALRKVSRPLSDPVYNRLRADCRRIYAHFCPVDYGTFDVRIDAQGQHYFLEFNADATLHPARTLAQCCSLNGVDFNGMIELILASSFERQNLTWR